MKMYLLSILVLCAACTEGHINSGSDTDPTGSQSGASSPNGVSALIGGPALDTSKDFPPDGQDCGTTLGQGNVVTTPPQAYVQECSGCHGPDGRGHDIYPSLLGSHTLADFSKTVRNGDQNATGSMPAFTANRLSDNELNRVYAFVTQTPIAETQACTPKAPMSASDIADAYARGLATWRTPDGKQDPNNVVSNVACVNCHGPDAMEFAYMGFSDSDIMRRGARHFGTPADYENIVDMVHAIRAKYNIPRRDPHVARPFQPGGAVLNGNTVAQRDAAFATELQQMKLLAITGYVNSPDQAAQAENEIWGINRHTLEIPIPFNHWSEDQFHNADGYVPDCSQDIDTCPDHGTVSDWIPVAPHIPASPNDMYAVMDSYLNNPTDATLQSMITALPNDTQMTGTYSVPELAGLDGSKYPGIYFAQHCMRLEVMGLPGCYDKGVAPFPYQNGPWGMGTVSNLFGTGYEHDAACDSTWQSCAAAPANLYDWPQHILGDLTPGSKLSDHFARLRHTWMTMWWAHFDPSLLVTGDPTAQQDEYFTRSIFWSNNNDWDNYGQPVNPTYSTFNVYQILMHNVALLHTPTLYSCDKFPFSHPDLGAFPCTSVDVRSGYYPELTNFAEGKDFIHNDSNYQTLYQPQDARKAAYQQLAGNMYRIFFWKLIGSLQQSNWMCRPDIEKLRIARAQAFLQQPEIVAANGPADQKMFSTLESLMSQSQQSCPAFSPQ